MKKLLLITAIGCTAWLASCSYKDDESYQPDRPFGSNGILDQSGSENMLSQIIFTLDLTYRDSLYLLTDQLFGVEFYLNNREWGTFTSVPLDTTAFDGVQYAATAFSEKPVQYLFVTNDQTGLDTLKTAGDYSLALRDFLTLQPGDYVAEIRSISWMNKDGQLIKRAVRNLIPFTLKPNEETLFLGAFITSVKL